MMLLIRDRLGQDADSRLVVKALVRLLVHKLVDVSALLPFVSDMIGGELLEQPFWRLVVLLIARADLLCQW